MASAYVLINCDLGSEDSIVKDISALDGVKKVEQVHGVYDIIVSVESSNSNTLKDIIAGKIRRLPKVRSTLTLMVS